MKIKKLFLFVTFALMFVACGKMVSVDDFAPGYVESSRNSVGCKSYFYEAENGYITMIESEEPYTLFYLKHDLSLGGIKELEETLYNSKEYLTGVQGKTKYVIATAVGKYLILGESFIDDKYKFDVEYFEFVNKVQNNLKECLNHTKNNSALEILKERYVRGDITKEEYEKMKKDILD